MAKDAKGHGSEALHEHRGWEARKAQGGVKVFAPNGKHAATHPTLMGAKQAMPHYAKGYETAVKRNAGASAKAATVNMRGDVSSPTPRKKK